MNKKILYLVVAVAITVSSCKSCKNKLFTKEEAKVDTVSATDDIYAGLADTTSYTADTSLTTAAPTTSETTTSTTTEVRSGNTSNKSQPVAATEKSTTATVSAEKTKEVEQSAAKSTKKSSNYRGSRSIYDGINDQEERYVIRKAEGYNDAYYVDDYNGSNKFYENHYKKASTFEKPMEEYIDKAANLPRSAYAKGPTQKAYNAKNPIPKVEEPTIAKPVESRKSGSIGTSKQEIIDKQKANEKPKNAQDMLKK